MNSAQKINIILSYSKVLVEESKKGAFISISRLPFSREDIKQALVETLQNLDSDARAETRKQIEVTYLYLAHFIPDEDAQELSAYWEGLENSDDETRLKKQYELQQSDVYMKKFQELSILVEKEREKLSVELELLNKTRELE